jgi:hypothetical protein
MRRSDNDSSSSWGAIILSTRHIAEIVPLRDSFLTVREAFPVGCCSRNKMSASLMLSDTSTSSSVKRVLNNAEVQLSAVNANETDFKPRILAKEQPNATGRTPDSCIVRIFVSKPSNTESI